jgi:cell wall integrity and stress response component
MIFNTKNALAVTSVLLAATSAAADGFKVRPRAALGTLVGCYSAIPGYGDAKAWTYQSSGWCLDRCYGQGTGAFALSGGSDCTCGDTLPPSSDKVSSDKCNKPCSGWPQDMCGGVSYYSIYTTNYDDDVPTYSDSSQSSSTTTTGSSTTTQTGAATAVSTAASGQTVIVTSESSATPTTESNENEKASSSKNTAAIAAGVVVGVVGFAALCGAVFFWWRSKNNKANAATRGPAGYGHDSSPPSMSDSRFDGDYMAQRRQSNGSIDDDHDFSRRILQVTNPDR